MSETDPKEAPKKLFEEIKRLYEGFERAFIKEEGRYPAEILELGLNEILATVNLMREAELTMRKKMDLDEHEWQKHFGDRRKLDQDAQKFLAEVDRLKEKIDREEARIHSELSAQKKLVPEKKEGVKKKGSKRGMKKKFRKMGGDGWIQG